MWLSRWERGELWDMDLWDIGTEFKRYMKKGIHNQGAGRSGRQVREVGRLGQGEP